MRDARREIRFEAARDDVEITQELLRVVVTLVPEPPPHERELAPVRLELVLRADRRRVLGQVALVARDRVLELARDRDERAVHRQGDRQLAYVCAIPCERELARTG